MKSRKINNLLNIKSHKNKNKNKKNSITRKNFSNNKTLKNKQEKSEEEKNKIILVGNAPTNLDNEFGNLINSYDIIIRFNEFVIKEYEKNIGTKTSIWVINDWVAINLLQKYEIWLGSNIHIKITIKTI